MSFLRPVLGTENYAVRGTLTGLRALTMADYAAWAAIRGRSRQHLMPFEPLWQHDELEKSAYRRRVRHYQRELSEDLGYAYAMLRMSDDELLGGISLSNVRRGVTQTASLGYWLGLPYARQGFMNDAVAAIIPYAIHNLGLHRIEAATLPDNNPSIRVLERNGFKREGFARRYLKINGVWRDHILFGLIAEDLQVAAAMPMAARRDGVAAL